ncbi:MAG: hypothetical protein JW995_05345 [Melioribacteraceae bacterium]|nr:hypothetical protein [Melioribacteraceae bacterium]
MKIRRVSINLLAFLLCVLFFSKLQAQQTTERYKHGSDFIPKFSKITNLQSFIKNIDENKILFASNNLMNYHYAYYADNVITGHDELYNLKINLFQIKHELSNNYKIATDLDDNADSGEDASFFSSELIYFIGAAAVATAVYILWSGNDKTAAKKTFGNPPKP